MKIDISKKNAWLEATSKDKDHTDLALSVETSIEALKTVPLNSTNIYTATTGHLFASKNYVNPLTSESTTK